MFVVEQFPQLWPLIWWLTSCTDIGVSSNVDSFTKTSVHDYQNYTSIQFSSLSHIRLFATPWTAAHQASLSITNSRSLLKLMSVELVMPSNHLMTYVMINLKLTFVCQSLICNLVSFIYQTSFLSFLLIYWGLWPRTGQGTSTSLHLHHL